MFCTSDVRCHLRLLAPTADASTSLSFPGRQLLLASHSCRGLLHTPDLPRGIHAAATALAAAMARGFVFPVVQPVVVGEFLPRTQVSHRSNEDTPINLVHFAIRVAGMINEHSHPVAIDDDCAIADSEQVGERASVVSPVSLLLGDTFTRIFEYDRAPRNIFQCETAGSMNVRRAGNQAGHVTFLPTFAWQYSAAQRAWVSSNAAPGTA